MADRLKGKKTLNVTGFLDEFEKDDVKKNIDIINLFKHFNIQLTKKGKNHIGLCPWHKDSNPSLSVDRAKGLYNCFGCGESGDIFTLVEKMKGFNFKESLAFLKSYSKKQPLKIIPLNVKDNSEVKSQDEKERETGQKEAVTFNDKTAKDKSKTDTEEFSINKDNEEEAFEETETSQSKILNTVTNYYHKKLLENKVALDYLKGRGIKKPSLLSRFKIGFCDGTIIDKVSTKDQKRLQEKGIFNEKGREHFLNCITFPILDDNNNTKGIYGRKIKESSVPHLYLKGKHLGIFNSKSSKVHDSIILTESIIDALSLIETGLENTQALYGTNGLTDFHLKRLKDDRVKEIIIALDNDEAGKEAAERLKEKLVEEDFDVKIIYPDGKDWNEDLLQNTDNLKELVNIKISESQNFINPYKKTKPAIDKQNGTYNFVFNEVTYRVSGVKDVFVNNLRVNVKATLEDEKFYDNLDLYSARSRTSYSLSLAKIFDLEVSEIERNLITILEYLEHERDKKLSLTTEVKEEIIISKKDRQIAMEFLTDRNMFSQIVKDMEILGYVGEDINKQLMYIAASSIKLDDPISVLITSQSSSGKSFLVDTVKELMPPEDIVEATSLSDQALNYVGDLKHKFLVLSEAVHKDVVEHQLREMVSSKRLSRLVTRKDPKSGELVTTHVKQEAIVSTVMSTTSRSINPENASRCFIIETDESIEQTKRIHEVQRRKHTLERHYVKLNSVPIIKKKHRTAQRLLKKIFIVNEFGKHLDFPVTLMRSRRDHDRFMDLIAVVCFLRQYQKKIKEHEKIEYIECDFTDYEISRRIMVSGVLKATMHDIPKSAIELYNAIRKYCRNEGEKKNLKTTEISFTQRNMREKLGFGHTWIKSNLRLLVDYEYIIITAGGRTRQKSFYRLRDDESIEEFNLSMIPATEKIKELFKTKQNE